MDFYFCIIFSLGIVPFMQRINCDSCIESHLINTRNTLNKITGVAKPEQVIGLLHQALASGMAYILGGKKPKPQIQNKPKAILHIQEGTLQYYTMKILSQPWQPRAVMLFSAAQEKRLNSFHSILKKNSLLFVWTGF